jgi:hypothetical protein
MGTRHRRSKLTCSGSCPLGVGVRQIRHATVVPSIVQLLREKPFEDRFLTAPHHPLAYSVFAAKRPPRPNFLANFATKRPNAPTPTGFPPRAPKNGPSRPSDETTPTPGRFRAAASRKQGRAGWSRLHTLPAAGLGCYSSGNASAGRVGRLRSSGVQATTTVHLL